LLKLKIYTYVQNSERETGKAVTAVTGPSLETVELSHALVGIRFNTAFTKP
jgi:hypothetical protein